MCLLREEWIVKTYLVKLWFLRILPIWQKVSWMTENIQHTNCLQCFRESLRLIITPSNWVVDQFLV